MGAGQSTSFEAQAPSRGLHILRVTPSSPASYSDIEPFFDFVIGYEGDSASSNHSIDASELEKIVERHEGKTLSLIIWSSKYRDTRVVPIVPSREWSLAHSNAIEAQTQVEDSQPSLLGLSMRMCEPEFSLENVWHVLDVLEGSPAESAGLVPYGDWIVGWSGGVLSAENDFYDLVEAHVDKPLRVYVYSYDFDSLREVVLIPNRQWGGEGLVGCVFGFGLLHRIPLQAAEQQLPLELQEGAEEYRVQRIFDVAEIGQSDELTSIDMHGHGQDDWRRELESGQPTKLSTSPPPQLHPETDNRHPALPDVDYDEADGHQDPGHTPSHHAGRFPQFQRTPIAQRSWTPTSFTAAPRAYSNLNGTPIRTSTVFSDPQRTAVRSGTNTPRSVRSRNEDINQDSFMGIDTGSENNSTSSLTSVD